LIKADCLAGVKAAQELAQQSNGLYRVLLIEANTHFHHLFAFPRFAVTTGVNTAKAFIPFQPGVFKGCPAGSGIVVQARAVSLRKDSVQLDREVQIDGERRSSIPFSFLVIATGTKLSPPSTLPGSAKLDGVTYLQKHAQRVVRSKRIGVIGAGAVGVQMATDIKELYPNKSVTLIHSRQQMMNAFHPQLSEIVRQRCEELGIELQLGSRVRLPPEGYPTNGSDSDIELEDGTKLPVDFAIISTGQTPQSDIMKTLAPDLLDIRSFIRVRRTLQLDGPDFPSIFAVGDVADTGAHKAARPGFGQASMVASNIMHLLKDEPLDHYNVEGTGAIHLTLGIRKSVIFRNPPTGSSEPVITHKDDGQLDMGIDSVWERRGGGPDAML
jgi:apoptosis-inducing factor 2